MAIDDFHDLPFVPAQRRQGRLCHDNTSKWLTKRRLHRARRRASYAKDLALCVKIHTWGFLSKRGSERFFDFLPDNPGESGFSPTAKTAAVQRWTPITTFPPLVQEVSSRGLPASHGNRAGRVRQVSGMRVQTTETTPARSAIGKFSFRPVQTSPRRLVRPCLPAISAARPA